MEEKHKDSKKELIARRTHRRWGCLGLLWLPLVLIFFLFLLQRFGFTSLIGAFRITRPKPIVASSTKLPQAIQQAIENLAKGEIKDEQAQATLAIAAEGGSLNQGIFGSVVDIVEEAVSSDPVKKATIRLRRIDRRIGRLQNLLKKDTSEKAVGEAVKIIETIGRETDSVAINPAVQQSREVLSLLIEQYNRLQIILQKREEKLPVKEFLTLEEARVKYLVSGAQKSINGVPNLQIIHNLGIKEVTRIMGKDFAELKVVEILSDIERGLTPPVKEKLRGLEKEVVVAFEKQMLPLPVDVRNRKLQAYIQYSFGNPLRQAQAFERMKDFLSDREMILGLNSLKELALQKLEDRVFQISDGTTLNKFLTSSLQDPSDLKILAQMKLDVLAGKDEGRKKRMAELEANSLGKVVEIFGKNKDLATYFGGNDMGDVLGVSVTTQLATILENSPLVSDQIKSLIKDIKTKTLKNFVGNIAKSAGADVRLLLSTPYGLTLLESIKSEVSDPSVIAIAERAESKLMADHVLTQVHDPAIFDQYQEFISNNVRVKQLVSASVGPQFFTRLAKKKQVIAQEEKEEKQKLYEKMQQIVQAIFISADNQASSEEKKLSQDIQQEIKKLKGTLPAKNIPTLATPLGVVLPEIAKLPSDVEQAIIEVAKSRIQDKAKPEEVKADLRLVAKDLGVGEPIILPDNPIYKVKTLMRLVGLALTLDPIQRAELLIKQDNEKTFEAAKLIEKNSSTKTIDTAVAVLADVQKDFAKLKSHGKELTQLRLKQPANVDALVSRIIANGLARQTVFSAIEEKVYGDDFVRIEKIRQDVLKDGVEALLQFTDYNIELLVQKLEQAVDAQTGSQFKELKAIDLLTEIKRTQPREVGLVLGASEARLAKKLENKILAMPAGERTKKLLAYARSLPGNPVRQFEAYDTLKDDFTNPQTKLIAEALKDTAVANLKERISEIPDATALREFVDAAVGNKPEDLKIVTEIALRVDQPKTSTIVFETPIEQKIDEIKATVEQNIVDAYKDKPQELAQTDFFATTVPDIIDVKVAQELTDILSRSPEVEPAVVELAKKTEATILNEFVDAISPTTASVDILEPVPEVIRELVELKETVSGGQQAKIDVAITAEVALVQEYLTAQTTDSTTFQADVAQIQTDPVVAATVTSVGGQSFATAVEEKAQTIVKEAATEQTKLETTVAQVQQEVFSAPVTNPSPVEQTLPQTVQQEIKEIKQDVPAVQIPVVTVSTPTTPQPTSAPEPATPAPQAPAPAAPEVKAPETQSAPAPEAPAAPALPGL
ncbi:hypothetical protein HY086_01525 [Candidatus Gottesmanbacteria bacterium]|nr:hypothetical protein [Candidatus Gottesmanbacteria bacterium]